RHTRFSRDWSSDVCSSDLGLHDRSVRIGRVDLDRLVRVISASHQSGNVRLVLADNTLHAGGDHLTGKTLNVEGDFLVGERNVDRSEEHTSELQSRENLVCR